MGARQEWLLPASGMPASGPLARVAVSLRTFQPITYQIPAELEAALSVGARVEVPISRRRGTAPGWVIDVSHGAWKHTHLSVTRAIVGEAGLSPALVRLGLWLADYYHYPPGLTLDALSPLVTRKKRTRSVRYVALAPDARIPDGLPDRQAAVLAAVAAGPRQRAELLQSGVSSATLLTLKRKRFIEITDRAELVEPSSSGLNESEIDFAPQPEDEFALTQDQLDAIAQIEAQVESARFAALLLFGVPGSGKTEVYVRAARVAVSAGKQVILLVPEIALATQLVARLARRFRRVAVLHSRMTPSARAAAHAAIANGRADVVIGTRTAVFAPTTRLGLILVDEEQEGSYKNQTAPYFHARDVALKRGQLEGVPVVLGSATPSLEAWHNAAHLDSWRLLRLRQRVPGARLPAARLIDMSKPQLGQVGRLLSPELLDALRETFRDGAQAILLHNRRGYALALRCETCGLPVLCDRCGAQLVQHRTGGGLKCHRCGWQRPMPAHCLDETCGGRLRRGGLAIQKLEEELSYALPKARLLRLDRDTMKHRDDYERALAQFERGEAQILLGTQMIAKGLDFPRVRLVGVLDADTTLRLPEFRAAEHGFQLLTQVIGRAGRRDGDSWALVQTGDLRAPALKFATQLDYESFARHELPQRAALGYPPFGRLIRIVLTDERPGQAAREAARVENDLRTLAGRVHAEIRVLPAAACVIPRLREMRRYEVLIRLPREIAAPALLSPARAERLLAPRVKRVTIDVDPLDLL